MNIQYNVLLLYSVHGLYVSVRVVLIPGSSYWSVIIKRINDSKSTNHEVPKSPLLQNTKVFEGVIGVGSCWTTFQKYFPQKS